MKISRNTSIVLIILLVLIGIAGTYFFLNQNRTNYFNSFSANQRVRTDQELINYVQEFVSRQFGNNYQAADIFIFSNSPYYISVVEKESGKGAFELLFNPNSGRFQPEPGPNMIWNRKYGMGQVRSWRGTNRDYIHYDYNNYNQISRQNALENARQYLARNNREIKVDNEGHEFYGYYTFHTFRDDKASGMLSVNAITGEIWYHNWHGNLEKIIELAEEHSKEE